MITRIEVDGFKSLSGFNLDLRPGLNVMVGPNGSGKTNVIQFFEFLAHLVRGDVSEAVSRLGGAGSIFRRKGSRYYQPNISATVYGSRLTEREKYVTYRYEFEIVLPKKVESIIYRRQSLAIHIGPKFMNYGDVISSQINWQLDMKQEYDEKLKPTLTLAAMDPKLWRFPFLEETKSKNLDHWHRRLREVLMRVLSPYNSLISAIPRYTIRELTTIFGDLARGDTYNIIPSRVKVPEDSAKIPVIEKDGGGLASTLYAIRHKRIGQMRNYQRHLSYAEHEPIPDISLSDVVRYVALANEAIIDIEVHDDPFNNQLKVTLKIKNDNYAVSLPLASMSDGTVKWLALITALLTSNSIFSLEEPENYLHPLMQSEILRIMREILFSHKSNTFTIMTTHSETILNNCKPEELIVLSLENGSTQARRCANAKELQREISKTGFGLGYYYLAGALNHE